jgi:phosphoglucosamine mutase
LKGWKICVDTANGATCETTPEVLRQLGAEVIARGNTPTGLNINCECGSEYPRYVIEDVIAAKAQLGIAHDGDGDRCILCDENGEILDGDEILAILGTDLLKRGELLSKTLIATVHSNLGLDQAIHNAGGEVARTPVGDRHVAEAMKRIGSNLGGESSGHIITPLISPTGDGASAALHVISVMQRTGKKLSELRKVMQRYPQAYVALSVKEKKPLLEFKNLQKKITTLEATLKDQGMVLVRYSGTEMKLRLMVQADDLKTAEESLSQLVDALKEDLS